MRTTIPAAVAALVAGFAIGGPSVRAASEYVDLELILAVDVSRSMDYDEQKVQRDGYVKALRSPEIMQAIRSGPFGRIAITYMEWSSSYYQQTLVPWTIVATADDMAKFTDALAAAPISTDSRTSIANALLYAQAYFNKASYNTDRRTVDVSGDGSNNDGTTLMPVRDRLVADGIVINGLPILLRPSNIFGVVRQRRPRRLLQGVRHRRSGIVRDPHPAGERVRSRPSAASSSLKSRPSRPTSFPSPRCGARRPMSIATPPSSSATSMTRPSSPDREACADRHAAAPVPRTRTPGHAVAGPGGAAGGRRLRVGRRSAAAAGARRDRLLRRRRTVAR